MGTLKHDLCIIYHSEKSRGYTDDLGLEVTYPLCL